MRSQNQILFRGARRLAGILACVIGISAAAGPSSAQELRPGGFAVVRGIVNGDTVTMGEAIAGATEIRLVGIQAPKQPLGRRGFQKWPLADAASAFLGRLVLDRRVRLFHGGRRPLLKASRDG